MASSSTPSQPVAAIMEDTPKTARAPADPVVPETQETATPAPAAPIEAEVGKNTLAYLGEQSLIW
jgi:hypothetical protein